MARAWPSRRRDVERLLLAALGGVPLVVAVGGQQAAPLGERPPERRLLGHGLHAGVDQPGPDRRVLGPRRHEPPAHRAEQPYGRRVLLGVPVATGDDGRDVLGGRDVPVRAAGARARRRGRPRTPRRGRRGSRSPHTCRTSLHPAAPVAWSAMARSRTDLDEDDVRVRPGRTKARPRSKDRPTHESATGGRVLTVDRGRFTCVADDGDREVMAVKARELGRKGVVVGDRVALVGDVSGEVDALARIVRVEPRTSVLRRTADDSDPVERVLVANADQLVVVTRSGRPRAAAAAHRPLPGRGVRRRADAPAGPHQGRPPLPRRAADGLRRPRRPRPGHHPSRGRPHRRRAAAGTAPRAARRCSSVTAASASPRSSTSSSRTPTGPSGGSTT